MKHRWGGLLPLAVLGAAAVVFAGCSSGSSANAAEAVRAASQNSTEAGSVSFEMKIEISGAPGAAFDTEAEGVYDFEKRQMQMVMDVLGQEMTAVLDGSTMYLKMPFLGEEWVKQDIEEVAGASLEGGQDPTQVLNWLSASGDDVEELGRDEIRGENATHYRALVNLRDGLDDLGAEQREALEQALEMIGEDELEIDVWVNDDGLPVRVRYEMAFTNSGIEQLEDAVMKFSLEYFDWGKPVRIDLPDPNEVVTR